MKEAVLRKAIGELTNSHIKDVQVERMLGMLFSNYRHLLEVLQKIFSHRQDYLQEIFK